jgi:hypothetical protein
MLRLVPALPLALLATTAAFAQTAPETANKDLWCGTAFAVAFNVELAPPGTSEEELAQARELTAAGQQLIIRGEAAYLAAGFTQDVIDKTRADLVSYVTGQIQSDQPDYGFDECTALVAALPPPDDGSSSAVSSGMSSSSMPSSSSVPSASSSSSTP